MEPLSVTASVLSVIQAAEAVISICCNYRLSVKGSSWEVSRILEDTRSLRSILRNLEELAYKAETSGSAEESRLQALESLCNPETGILSSCDTELEKLKRKLAPPGWSGPAGSKRRGLVEALSWPLKKKDTEKVLDSITRCKHTISLAIQADQIPSILAIEDATQETKESLTLFKNDTHGRNVRDWLHAIDPYPKYAKTINDRLPGTGAWLIEARKFDDWKKGRNSRLWLHGIVGCGKTVLCSTAIENVLEERSMSTNKAFGVAYFYFDFNNRAQQYFDTMLRSLISQLWLQNRENANAVDALYSACDSGASQPSLDMLKKALKELAQSFGDTFFILDALDECQERKDLMPYIEEMAVWKFSGLHMLLTSRKEKDIDDSLSTILDDEQRICIQSAQVEGDIRSYVRSRIRTDRELKKWQRPEVQTEIETVLMEKAGGMFQWVKCQLDALGRCLSPASLRKALCSLPKDLDDTYARILQRCDDDEHSKLVATIVQWLAYSRRPMSLAEISGTLTVNPDGDSQFDAELRLEDPQDLLKICSSLITTVPRPAEHSTSPGSDEMLEFAHFSVREYLESSRILDGPAKKYAIQEVRSNTFIAESCIIYLLHLDVSNKRTDDGCCDFLSREYPLARYAAYSWVAHAERAEEGGNIVSLSKALLREAYRLPECHCITIVGCYGTQNEYSPLVHASMFNVPKITSALILEGADVNATDDSRHTPLTIISRYKPERMEVAQLLLRHGANVNAGVEYGVSALKLAAIHGNLQIVRTLLDNGAEIDIRCRVGKTALIEAAGNGHTEVVRLLLDRGASIRHPIGVHALLSASSWGYSEIVRMLLERGVGVDAEMADTLPVAFTTALLRSLQHGEKDVAELLLKYGANVNAQSTHRGIRCVALQHALNPSKLAYGRKYDKVFMVDFLLEHGADPSLVTPEHLDEDGMRVYKERVLKNEVKNGSLQVQEEETEEARADA